MGHHGDFVQSDFLYRGWDQNLRSIDFEPGESVDGPGDVVRSDGAEELTFVTGPGCQNDTGAVEGLAEALGLVTSPSLGFFASQDASPRPAPANPWSP